MNLCPDLGLRAAYEVIVVGDGLGGLAAAYLFTKHRLLLLIIDPQN